MLHPHTELKFVSPAIGTGVFATQRIPRGTVVWVLDPLDQRLGVPELARLDSTLTAQVEKYSFASYDTGGERILCWDHARYVNHSCRPTCMGPPDQEFEVALRDILPGEELTDDYAVLTLSQPFDCACGESNCRGVIRPHDSRQLCSKWDARLERALARTHGVSQPLSPLFPGVGGSLEAQRRSPWETYTRRPETTTGETIPPTNRLLSRVNGGAP